MARSPIFAQLTEVGAARIPYISVETNVNMAGGQPLSMANLRATFELCRRHGILLMLDATRALENAWFIKQREDGYADRSVAEILESYGNGSGHVFNLGHGIGQFTPIDHVNELLAAVRGR